MSPLYMTDCMEITPSLNLPLTNLYLAPVRPKINNTSSTEAIALVSPKFMHKRMQFTRDELPKQRIKDAVVRGYSVINLDIAARFMTTLSSFIQKYVLIV